MMAPCGPSAWAQLATQLIGEQCHVVKVSHVLIDDVVAGHALPKFCQSDFNQTHLLNLMAPNETQFNQVTWEWLRLLSLMSWDPHHHPSLVSFYPCPSLSCPYPSHASSYCSCPCETSPSFSCSLKLSSTKRLRHSK